MKTMTERKGEKIGWTAGWLGGFIWVLILSAVFLFQDKWQQALVGTSLTAVAIAGIVYFAPWRHPATPYWKLMLVPLGLFFLTAAWGVWSYGGLEAVGLEWWNFVWFLPALIPLGNVGQRKWADGDKPPNDPDL